MRPNFKRLLDKCIEDGVRIGYERAHKHTDTPAKDYLLQVIGAAIDNELDEWFVFDNDDQ